MRLFDWLTGGGSELPAPGDSEGTRLVRALGEAAARARFGEPARSFDAGRAILEAAPRVRVDAVHASMHRLATFRLERTPSAESVTALFVLKSLVGAVLRAHLPLTGEDARLILARAAAAHRVGMDLLPAGSVVAAIERYVADSRDAEGVRPGLELLARTLRGKNPTGETRRLADRLDALLGTRKGLRLHRHDAWAAALQEELDSMDPLEADPWWGLLGLGHAATGARPSRKWLAEAKGLVDAIGERAFADTAARWFGEVSPPPPAARPTGLLQQLATASPSMHETNAACLRGLVWAASQVSEPDLARAVGDLGLRCFRKIPDYGPYSSKVGNACVFTLGARPGLDGVAQLGRLRLKVKYAVARKLIEKALDDAARRHGLPPDELEELSVPTFGLGEDHVRREELGACRAEVHLVGTAGAEIRWTDPEGKRRKGVPAEVRRDHGPELKELNQALRDLRTHLPVERQRLERLMLAEHPLPHPRWRERYVNHPLVGAFASRLIWHFRRGERIDLGLVSGDRVVDVEERPLAWVDDETDVRLWHPLGFDPEVVLAWRRFLSDHDLTQPFKQAHREIYVITDAELTTERYSNRFAAHILRQHPFAALCRERGWRYTLQGQWDSHNVPTLPLPRFGMRAEFWVEALWEDSRVSDMGIFLNVSTDQVRFCDEEGEPRPLHRVPALLFSEVMRDVDLFVSVTSIAADPTWHDQGPQEARTYWERQAFGELGAAAEDRAAFLAELLPRLKIASRCRIEGRFLRVQGDRRAYKIHLGSGNVLMEPNDQYLCIVPDRSAAARQSGAQGLVLPFEGDTTLTVILSKALMLADDTEITDPDILRQIRS